MSGVSILKSGFAKNEKRLQLYICIIFLTIFSLRIINLDNDLPPWGLAGYQPIDEGSYAILALNYTNYHTFNAANSDPLVPGITPPHVRVNFIGNMVSLLSIIIFGKNYFGLRFPSVLWSAGIALFTIFSLMKHAKNNGWRNIASSWLGISALIIITMNFANLIASRVVEPSIVRAFMNALLLVIFIFFRDKEKLRVFLLGLIATLSILFVYVSNAFIALPCAAVAIVPALHGSWRKSFERIAFMGLGVLIAIALAEPYYRLVWNTGPLKNLFTAVADFNGAIGYKNYASIRGLVKNAVAYWSANVFFYDPILFSLNIFGLFVNIRAFIIKRDEVALFILAVIIGFFIQTLYSNDYIVRKMESIFPILIFNAGIAIMAIRNMMETRTAGNNKTRLRQFVVNLIVNYSIIAGLTISYAFRIFIVNDGTALDFGVGDRRAIFIVLLFAATCLAIQPFLVLPMKTRSSFFKITGLCFLFPVMLGGSYFAVKYIYGANAKSEKAIMLELASLANDEFVLGEYENGFSLYNRIKPVLQTKEKIREYAMSGKAHLFFDYDFEKSELVSYFYHNVFKGCDVNISKVREFRREFQTFGLKRNVTLYRIDIPKK
jgi:hypothetical protein